MRVTADVPDSVRCSAEPLWIRCSMYFGAPIVSSNTSSNRWCVRMAHFSVQSAATKCVSMNPVSGAYADTA